MIFLFGHIELTNGAEVPLSLQKTPSCEYCIFLPTVNTEFYEA